MTSTECMVLGAQPFVAHMKHLETFKLLDKNSIMNWASEELLGENT